MSKVHPYQRKQLRGMTTAQLEMRLTWIEDGRNRCKDEKSLPVYNSMYQAIIEELARRDVENDHK